VKFLVPVLGTVALLLGSVNPLVAAPIATIDGIYDASGAYGGQAYDTPTLVFHNTSSYDFINTKVVLTGYQGTNNGVTQTLTLGTMPAGKDYVLVWAVSQAGVTFPPGPPASTNAGAPDATNQKPGDLFTYDYDDEYGVVSSAQPGNFSVTFTATLSGAGPLNGQPIFSVFSPTTNFTGGFVGWEGLDQNGFAESVFDNHNTTVSGILAEINLGLPPGVPEPTSLALFGLATLTAGYFGLRRKSPSA
jgi:hypothetical protein